MPSSPPQPPAANLIIIKLSSHRQYWPGVATMKSKGGLFRIVAAFCKDDCKIIVEKIIFWKLL